MTVMASRRRGWTVFDRVVAGLLMLAQCALYVVGLLSIWLFAYTGGLVRATFVAQGVVAIVGPVVIAVTAVFVLRAIDRDELSFWYPVAGIGFLIALYVFPAILVSAANG